MAWGQVQEEQHVARTAESYLQQKDAQSVSWQARIAEAQQHGGNRVADVTTCHVEAARDTGSHRRHNWAFLEDILEKDCLRCSPCARTHHAHWHTC